jgi:predicted DNA-binding transcriptional regulator YafY
MTCPADADPDELEAAVLGASWVAARGDPQLAQGARDLVAKLGAIVPEALRPIVLDAALKPVSFAQPPAERIDMAALRLAIRERRKLAITYVDAQGASSRRVIWPVFLAYMEAVRVVVAWCETRADFRHFRTDRMVAIAPRPDVYPAPRERLIAAWQAHLAARSTHRPRKTAATDKARGICPWARSRRLAQIRPEHKKFCIRRF